MSRVNREGPIQVALVAYLRRVLPDAIVHHSPNEGNRGGVRGMRDGARRKAQGVLAGFPDILIFHDGDGYCIEVKPEGEYQSDAQKRVQKQLAGQGIPYAVCRSIDDVRETLNDWGIRTKEAQKLA